jgi:hypothetical protein
MSYFRIIYTKNETHLSVASMQGYEEKDYALASTEMWEDNSGEQDYDYSLYLKNEEEAWLHCYALAKKHDFKVHDDRTNPPQKMLTLSDDED